MRTQMISSATAQEIRFRISNGEKIRTIAQSLGISRNTVRSYMRDADKGFQKVEAGSIGGRHKLAIGNDASLANLYLQARGNSAVIRRRVQATPEAYGLPNGFKVSDRSIRRFYASRHPELIKRARDEEVNPFFVKPGQQLQIDFVEAKFRFAGQAEEETVYIFEATYAWSRKSYVRVCPDMTQASWMISICDCLQKNGIPLEILCDNDKSLVISHGKEHVRFNPSFEWLCKPLGILPRACRPRRAATKGRIERYGRYLQENGLVDCGIDSETIPDRTALQKKLDEWIEHTADIRVWDTVQYGKATTRDLYAKERALLRFPEALKTCFDVTCWPARTTDEGIVYVYGTAVHLGPNYRGGQTVYVAVRLNGEVLVTNAAGNVIRMTDIPPENLHEFKMDQPPPTSRSAFHADISKKGSRKSLLSQFDEATD